MPKQIIFRKRNKSKCNNEGSKWIPKEYSRFHKWNSTYVLLPIQQKDCDVEKPTKFHCLIFNILVQRKGLVRRNQWLLASLVNMLHISIVSKQLVYGNSITGGTTIETLNIFLITSTNCNACRKYLVLL